MAAIKLEQSKLERWGGQRCKWFAWAEKLRQKYNFGSPRRSWRAADTKPKQAQQLLDKLELCCVPPRRGGAGPPAEPGQASHRASHAEVSLGGSMPSPTKADTRPANSIPVCVTPGVFCWLQW